MSIFIVQHHSVPTRLDNASFRSSINCCLNSSKFIVFSSIEIKVNVCLILLVSAPHRPYEWELQRLKSILFQTARFVLRLLTRRPQNLFQALSPLPDVVGIRTANPRRCDYSPPGCYFISSRYTFSLSVLGFHRKTISVYSCTPTIENFIFNCHE